MYRGSLRYFGLAIVLLAAAGVASAQSRTRTVALAGEAAPGGGVFAPTLDRITAKGLPTIGGNTIAFGSDVQTASGTVYSIFVESANVTRVATRVGAPAPGGGTIQDISYFSVDRFGNVFMTVRVGNGAEPDTVLAYSFGVLSDLARVGDELPDGKVITAISPVAAPDGFAGAYFQVTYSGGQAIVNAKADGTIAIVAASGMPAPGGGTFGAFSGSTLASSSSGLVGFAATVDGGTSGIFTGLPGNLFLAAPAVDASPNLTIADNDDVEVSFMQPAMPGIKTATLTGTTTFVTNGVAAPRTTTGIINFGAFQVGMAADREGSLYFFAPIANDTTHGAGLFSRDRFTGVIKALVLQGDPAPGDVSGVFGLFALNANKPTRIANDEGRVVFAATSGSGTDDVGFFTTLGAPDGLVPSIANITVKKTKITIVGSNFEPGARILVNGVLLTDTKNDKNAPTTKLKSKTGGSRIAPGATVSVAVLNPTGAQSAPVQYTRPR